LKEKVGDRMSENPRRAMENGQMVFLQR